MSSGSFLFSLIGAEGKYAILRLSVTFLEILSCSLSLEQKLVNCMPLPFLFIFIYFGIFINIESCMPFGIFVTISNESS